MKHPNKFSLPLYRISWWKDKKLKKQLVRLLAAKSSATSFWEIPMRSLHYALPSLLAVVLFFGGYVWGSTNTQTDTMELAEFAEFAEPALLSEATSFVPRMLESVSMLESTEDTQAKDIQFFADTEDSEIAPTPLVFTPEFAELAERGNMLAQNIHLVFADFANDALAQKTYLEFQLAELQHHAQVIAEYMGPNKHLLEVQVRAYETLCNHLLAESDTTQFSLPDLLLITNEQLVRQTTITTEDFTISDWLYDAN